MARSRNIKPGLFKNELLGEADPMLSLLFIGLWCLADREGRLEDRHKRIKAEIFPYRTVDVDELLNWLENELFIHRYQVDNESFIQIAKFHIHQKPHHMETESVIHPMVGEENKFKAKPLYPKQKERILERDGKQCRQCGNTKNLHIDHILPVSKGGTSDDENLQVLCRSCNCSKGNKTDNESSTNRQRIDKSVHSALIPDSLIPDSLIPDSLERGTPKNKRKKPTAPPKQWLDNFPESFPDDLWNWAKENKLAHSAEEIKNETEKMIDHFNGEGKRKKDWNAVWRNWMKRAEEFRATRH